MDITERTKTEEAFRKNEARHHSYVELTGQLAWTTDSNGEVVEDIPLWRQFTGLSYEETKGLGWTKALHPEDAEHTKQVWAKAVKDKSAYEVEYRLRRFDGVYRDFLTRGIPVLREDGSIREWAGVNIDITERKRAEEALYLFKDLVQHSSDAIGVSTPDGKHYYQNAAFDLLFGDIGDCPPATVYVDQATGKQVFDTIMGGGSWQGEVKMFKKDRTILDIFQRASAIQNQDGRIVGLVGLHTDITERNRAGAALRDSEARYRALFETSADGILIADLETKAFKYANPAMCQMLGYAEEELITLGVADIHPKEDLQRVMAEFEAQARGEKKLAEGLPCIRKDGTIVFADVNATTVAIDNRRCLVGFFRDITERKQMEEQLRQSQKLESVGLLAGGVAHDFNNLLAGILGYCDLILDRLSEDDPLAADVKQIEECGQRAATLTRQLLAFSRKLVLQPMVLDVNQVVSNLDRMLRRIIGEDIDLKTVLAPDLGKVKADPGHIEQVIVNLAVNSRDAMPQGGRLTIETRNIQLGEEYARTHVAVVPGPHVMIAVSDTGCGMDETTMGRLFEPFFTTKEKGKGTGLGLSTVYGIVKQSGGNIWCYSEPGKGTTFKIYLPRVEEGAAAALPKPTAAAQGGSETVLVVEDDPSVRDLLVRMLKRAGHKVIEAKSGAEALLACRNFEGAIQLLVTDVVMPGMSGRQLAESLKDVRPGIKILYTSGYTDNAIVHHGVLDEGTPFLQKPFTMESLRRKVRDVLDRD